MFHPAMKREWGLEATACFAASNCADYILQNSHNILQYNEYIVEYGLNIIAIFLAPLGVYPRGIAQHVMTVWSMARFHDLPQVIKHYKFTVRCFD